MLVIEQLKSMSPERFGEIYAALENGGYGPMDAEVAKAMKFRPMAIKKLPMEQRARRAYSLLRGTSNAELAYELFGSYILRTNRELITDFLDAADIEHEEGLISDGDKNEPDDDKVAEIIAELDKKYPPDDVTLYISMCTVHWPDTPAFKSLWHERTGVAEEA